MMVNKSSVAYPHFICIGPKKSATTWLADHLKLQFDMWFPPTQELSYCFRGLGHLQKSGELEYRNNSWDVVKRLVRNKSITGTIDRRFYALANHLVDYDPGGEDFSAYESIFKLAEGKITGDISPVYASLKSAQISKLEAETQCQTVFMFLRDPVARFFSHYKLIERYRGFGEVDYSSDYTVAQFLNDPIRSQDFYPSQIHKKWSNIWGERFSVFDFEDVTEHPKATLDRIIRHVGGNPRARVPFVPAKINRNVAHTSAKLTQQAQRLVHEHFIEELEACCDVFGSRAEGWLERSHNFLSDN